VGRVKIRSIEAIPVRAPRTKPMVAAAGPPLVVSDFGVVRLRTEEDLEGLGEISMNGGRTGAIQCDDVNRLIAPALTGCDARDLRGLIVRMDQALGGSEPAKAAVEMALFDVIGKRLGVPVYQLLGGKVRDRAPVCWGLGFGPPEPSAEEAARYVAEGFRTIKIKVGRPGTDLDIRMIGTVRKRLGEAVELKVDANTAYSSPMQAIQEIRRMEQFRLQMVEQPLKGDQLEGMAYVRSHISTPVLADESMWRWQDAYAVARAGAADVLNVYVSEAGGLLAATKAFAIGEAAGLPALIGSQCELGIGTAAMAHLAVTMPNLAYESDITGHLRYPIDIICEKLDYCEGSIRPPDAPGLGVTLNEDVLSRWRLDR
jgi:L-alanine-DL-glutamate epimerase-like enolase superfamily enzyme